MDTQTSRQPAASLKLISKYSSIAVLTIGLSVLVGWIFDISVLKSLHPNLISMKANTAIAFLLAGISLWLLQSEEPGRLDLSIIRVCSGGVILLGLLTLCEYLSGFDLGIDQLFFREAPRTLGTTIPGRMAPNTALNCLFLGISLLCLDVETKGGRRPAQYLAAASLMIALLALIGYICGVAAFSGLASYTNMALNTSITFIILSIGVLCARPEHGIIEVIARQSSGGHQARRLLPAAIIIPMLLGWFLMIEERSRHLGTGHGISIFVVLVMFVFVVLIWSNCIMLDRAEKESRSVQAEKEVSGYTRSLIEASLDPLVTISPQGKITDVNMATIKVSGHSREELIGTDFSDYFTEPENARQGYQQVFAKGFVKDYPLIIRHKEGKLTEVMYNAVVYRDSMGKILGVFAAARDVTERNRAEARIVLQNNILNAINQVFLEVLSCETEESLCQKSLHVAEELTESKFGLIAQLNQAGTLDTIALSDPGWDACRMPKTNAVRLLKNLKARGIFGSIVKKGRGAAINDPGTFSERVGTPDGHPEIACFLGIPLKQAGETIGLVGLANKEGGYSSSDLEAVEPLAVAIVEALMRKRAELKIQELNRDLEKRVIERTTELEAVNKELEAFAYSVSHDLRTPLRSINGFSRVLQEDYPDKLDAEGKDALKRIAAATERMGQLIDDLLNLSRMTRDEMRRASVDLSKIAREIAEKLREGQPERQVEFNITKDLATYGDEHLLMVLLENLINNAWKFTEKTPHAVIEFGVTPFNGESAYFVRDNGVGFDMAYAGKLFNPFERLHGVEQFPGTGIGLATVKRIVNRHGGRVWAEGAMGKGAIIYFTL